MKTLIILFAAAISLASCSKNTDDLGCVTCRTIYPPMYGVTKGEIVDTVFCGASAESLDAYIKANTSTIHYRPWDTGEYIYRITTECH